MMSGTKAAIDGLTAAVRTNITVTIDIKANDKDKVWVNAVCN